MGLSSDRGTSNDRLEPESFKEVVSKNPSGYCKIRMISNGKVVEPTSEFLRALRRFSQNPFGDHSDVTLFALAEHLYKDHISAPHRVYIFLSHKHLVAISETIWILASPRILKERGDCKGRRSLEAWKLVDNQ